MRRMPWTLDGRAHRLIFPGRPAQRLSLPHAPLSPVPVRSSFVGGAAYGRLVGELLLWVAPGFMGFARPGHFAIIGAAALTAAATGTMSTAVVCLELTGQLSLQLPILVATVAGYFAAKWLNVPSLFVTRPKELTHPDLQLHAESATHACG